MPLQVKYAFASEAKQAQAASELNYIIDQIQMGKGGWVYIMTNAKNTVLYTGVTSDLYGRVMKHRSNYYLGSFTSRYRCYKLVYYNIFPSIVEAIAEEKRIKGGSRLKKIDLVNSMNKEWIDLYGEIS